MSSDYDPRDYEPIHPRGTDWADVLNWPEAETAALGATGARQRWRIQSRTFRNCSTASGKIE